MSKTVLIIIQTTVATFLGGILCAAGVEHSLKSYLRGGKWKRHAMPMVYL